MSIILIIYHHVGYPLILRMAKSRNGFTQLEAFETPHYRGIGSCAGYPSMTILMPAYNEERYIQDKIRNLACLDYPPERFKVILACDGCSDNTAKLAREAWQEEACRHLNLEIQAFSKNRGKVALINALFTQISTPIVALTDVSSLVSVDALSIAASRFKDNTVGAINGNYRLLSPGSTGEAVYWRYQSRIKVGEEALGSVLGAHGAFYFIRTELFKPLAEDTINDDFILPMRTIEQGYRVVYEPRLNALELEQSDPAMDWQRRLRISTGNAQQISQLSALLHPKFGGIALAFFSGKALRVAMPFLMLLSLLGSWALSFNLSLFAVLAYAQTGIYILAFWVHIAAPNQISKLTTIIHYIVRGHVASLIGCIRYLRGGVSRW